MFCILTSRDTLMSSCVSPVWTLYPASPPMVVTCFIVAVLEVSNGKIQLHLYHCVFWHSMVLQASNMRKSPSDDRETMLHDCCVFSN